MRGGAHLQTWNYLSIDWEWNLVCQIMCMFVKEKLIPIYTQSLMVIASSHNLKQTNSFINNCSHAHVLFMCSNNCSHTNMPFTCSNNCLHDNVLFPYSNDCSHIQMLLMCLNAWIIACIFIFFKLVPRSLTLFN